MMAYETLYGRLERLGVTDPKIERIRSKAGISLFRAESEGKRYILKLFERDAERREIGNYRLLSRLEIPTLPLLCTTDDTILFPDITADSPFRLGTADDFDDIKIVRQIARWYRELHIKGRDHARKQRMSRSASEASTAIRAYFDVSFDRKMCSQFAGAFLLKANYQKSMSECKNMRRSCE